MSRLLEKYQSIQLRRKAALWFVVCNALQQGSRVLMMPALTRLMPADQYGTITLFNSWLAIFAIFVTLELSAGVFNKAMSLYPDDRDRYVSSMMGLAIALSIAALLIGLCLGGVYERVTGLGLVYLPFMSMTMLANIIFGLWASRKRYDYHYRPLIAGTFTFVILSAVLSVVAVALAPDGVNKALVQVATWACTSLLVALVLLLRTLGRARTLWNKEYWKFAVSFNIPLIPHYLASVVLGQIDRVMIAQMAGTEEAAIYTVAYQISIALLIVVKALNATITPWLYEKLGKGEYRGVTREIAGYLIVLSLLGVVLALVSPELIGVFAPAEYSLAVYVMPPVCASTLYMFVYNVYGSIEFFYMKNKFISVATGIAAVLNVILNFVFIPKYGFIAAGYTTLVSYVVMALMHTVFVMRIERHELQARIYKGSVLWGIVVAFSVVTVAVSFLYGTLIVRWLLVVVLLAAAAVAFKKRKSRN